MNELQLNAYVMGMQPIEIFLLYRAGIDFRRQNLTSKVDPRAVRGKCFSEYVHGHQLTT